MSEIFWCAFSLPFSLHVQLPIPVSITEIEYSGNKLATCTCPYHHIAEVIIRAITTIVRLIIDKLREWWKIQAPAMRAQREELLVPILIIAAKPCVGSECSQLLPVADRGRLWGRQGDATKQSINVKKSAFSLKEGSEWRFRQGCELLFCYTIPKLEAKVRTNHKNRGSDKGQIFPREPTKETKPVSAEFREECENTLEQVSLKTRHI